MVLILGLAHSFLTSCLQLDPNDQAAVKEMLRKAALQGLVVPDKKKSSTSALSEEVQDKTPPIK